ncbi:MAG: DNA-binding LacI/PurR family transcriptional regulator [Cellvibrionaceae bacterium]|jgi:DNA-binding LacI/PurR family transcriptional regulator
MFSIATIHLVKRYTKSKSTPFVLHKNFMSEKVTITDVARKAGVSLSTVSNLLNGRSKRMRPSTEQRIIEAIEELGFTPNQAARQLKTGHSAILGLIVPSVANPFYGIFARHVESAALRLGYQVLLGNSDRDPAREFKYAEELWGYGVRGLIFGSSLLQLSHFENLISKGLHVVAFERPAQETDGVRVDSVGIDNQLAARLATKHLLSLGHKRIGFLSGPIQTVSRLDRLSGYQSALREANIQSDPKLVWDVSPTGTSYGDADAVDLGRQGTQELLSRPNPPTAIFAINDMFAFGAYAGAKDLGLKIPDDLSVVGVDDITLTEIIQPSLTTVRQPIEQIANIAVARLVARLAGTFVEEQDHQILAPQLIVRSSTAIAPNRI